MAANLMHTSTSLLSWGVYEMRSNDAGPSRSTEALRWLQGQTCSLAQLMPRVYLFTQHRSSVLGMAKIQSNAAGSFAQEY